MHNRSYDASFDVIYVYLIAIIIDYLNMFCVYIEYITQFCEIIFVLVELRLTTYIHVVGTMASTYYVLDEMSGL